MHASFFHLDLHPQHDDQSKNTQPQIKYLMPKELANCGTEFSGR